MNKILSALSNLYEIWSKSGIDSQETIDALDKLMRVYDDWLN